jgi:DnaJ-class molecular chaperone
LYFSFPLLHHHHHHRSSVSLYTIDYSKTKTTTTTTTTKLKYFLFSFLFFFGCSPTFTKDIPQEGMPIPSSKGPSNGGETRGKLILKFNIDFPTYFNEEQKKVIRSVIP